MTPEELAALGNNTTPGPWRVGARRLCDVETSGGALVADCGVGVADARLVAAAPELLSALVAALEEVERLRGIVDQAAEELGGVADADLPAAVRALVDRHTAETMDNERLTDLIAHAVTITERAATASWRSGYLAGLSDREEKL
jgi:hypothetical protein